jgi:uroporphyrinogen-III synthase
VGVMQRVYILSNSNTKGAIKLPLIEQNFFLKEIDFLKYNYLIFTSKNGVKAADKISKDWRDIPALTIGRATANMVESLGGKVAFLADSFYGEEFAKDILRKISKKERLLLLRPKRVATDIGGLLRKNGLNVDEKVVYETVCNCKDLNPPLKDSAILFSSPSTIECFFKCFNWDSSYRAFAIGKKTAKYFKGHIEIAKGATLQECVDYIKNLV